MYSSKRTMKSTKKVASVNDHNNEIIMNAIFDLVLHNDKSGTCSLTGVHYDNYGNNAYPFEGRCCDNANSYYVIPARAMGITPEVIKKYGKDTIMTWIDNKHKEGKFNFQIKRK